MNTLEKIDKYLNESGDLDKLEKMIKNHDWWYRMADDPKARKKGEKERKDIMDMIKRIDVNKPGKAKHLYLKYAKENTGLTPEAEKELKKLEKEK